MIRNNFLLVVRANKKLIIQLQYIRKFGSLYCVCFCDTLYGEEDTLSWQRGGVYVCICGLATSPHRPVDAWHNQNQPTEILVDHGVTGDYKQLKVSICSYDGGHGNEIYYGKRYSRSTIAVVACRDEL